MRRDLRPIFQLCAFECGLISPPKTQNRTVNSVRAPLKNWPQEFLSEISLSLAGNRADPI